MLAERRRTVLDAGRSLAASLSTLPLPVVLVVALAVYAPTLNDWFSGDDFWFLRSSRSMPVGEYVAKAFDFRETGTLAELDRYRPLYPVTWRLAYGAFGPDAWGYHALLLAVHLANTALVWLIAHRLTKLRWAAGLAALIFALHPAYPEAVAWLSGGNRALATLPYLLGLLLFMRYAGGVRDRGLSYSGAFVAFVAAVLLHPSALTLVVVLPLYAFLVAGRPADALRPQAWLPLAPFAVVAGALVGIQFWVRSNLGVEEQFEFGWHQYSKYGNYLGMALVPVLRPDTQEMGDAPARVLEGLQGLASVAVLLLSVLIVARRRQSYVPLFVVAWLYVSLLPDSTLRFVVMGRVLYLPGAALSMFLVAAVLWCKDAMPARLLPHVRRAAPWAVAALLVPTIALTSYHAERHSDNAAQNRAFIEQLERSLPEAGGTGVLYVVDAPTNLVAFDDTRLRALVALYYGDLEVRSLTAEEAAEMEGSLPAGSRIFRFVR